MSTFDEREKAYEAKFTHDADLKFKATSRRNKALAAWASKALDHDAAAAAAYVKALQHAEAADHGDAGVLKKLVADFKAKGLTSSETDIKRKMVDLLAEAVGQIESERA